METDALRQAVRYRELGKHDTAIEILRSILEDDPDHADANYQMAWNCDILERERAAIDYYIRAIDGGLSVEDRRDALLGLGSTYRAIGEYANAVQTFRKASREFPDAPEFAVFLSMALYNTGDYQESVSTLLKLVAETSSSPAIQKYQRAILYYHDKLDATWE